MAFAKHYYLTVRVRIKAIHWKWQLKHVTGSKKNYQRDQMEIQKPFICKQLSNNDKGI